MQLLLGGPSRGDGALDLALAHALVQQAGSGDLDQALRVYRPSSPAVVFGRRDTHNPRFTEAVQASRSAGFQPLVRAVGGRPVAYTSNALVVDHVCHDTDAQAGMEARFATYGELYASVLRSLGIDARVGPVPGEYCPGAQSVNARGAVKLVGTAQRVVRDAWLFSALVMVGDAGRVREVLGEVYDLLELRLDPASVGAVEQEVPGLSIDTLERKLVAAFDSHEKLEPSELGDATTGRAQSLVDEHRL